MIPIFIKKPKFPLFFRLTWGSLLMICLPCIVFILSIVLITNCSNYAKEVRTDEQQVLPSVFNERNTIKFDFCGTITTIDYDSCEYVVLSNRTGIALVHKSNCKFCKAKKIIIQ